MAAHFKKTLWFIHCEGVDKETGKRPEAIVGPFQDREEAELYAKHQVREVCDAKHQVLYCDGAV